MRTHLQALLSSINGKIPYTSPVALLKKGCGAHTKRNSLGNGESTSLLVGEKENPIPYNKYPATLHLPGFLSLTTVNGVGQIVLCCACYPMCCWMFISILASYPLDASSNQPPTMSKWAQSLSWEALLYRYKGNILKSTAEQALWLTCVQERLRHHRLCALYHGEYCFMLPHYRRCLIKITTKTAPLDIKNLLLPLVLSSCKGRPTHFFHGDKLLISYE